MTTQTFGDVDIDGDGSQNLVGTVVNGDVIQQVMTFVRGRPASFLGPSWIADLVACHVPARNHHLVVKALADGRAVLVGGADGTGRTTAAVTAMRELAADLPVREFAVGQDDVAEIRAGGVRGYLVRPSDEEPNAVSACLDAARDAGAYLVVVGDDRQRRRLGLSVPYIELEQADPVLVYRRRLGVRGNVGEGWSRWEGAAFLLVRALPGDARRLADLVAEVDRRSGFTRGACDEVMRAYRGWGEELRGWFRENSSPQDRTLLIAAATLEDATDIDVYTAALALARQLRVQANGSGLAWAPAAGLQDLLKAEHEDGRIVFRRHGYAAAVLRHVWDDYPLTRPDLLSWLTELAQDTEVAERTRHALVKTFADLAAEAGLVSRVTDAAQAWARAGFVDLAFLVLAHTCLHPRVGGRIRRQLYHWSREERLPLPLKLTITRVCEPLGVVYPSIALTRLKHLGTNGGALVRAQVAEAALGLARIGHWVEVLDAAFEWCAGPGREALSHQQVRRRMDTGARVSLELVSDVAAEGWPTVLGFRRVRECDDVWRAVLSTTPPLSGEAIGNAVRLWLNTALRWPELRTDVVEGFVAAARPAPDPMIRVAEAWAAVDPGDPDRRRIGEDLVLELLRPWRAWLSRYVRMWAWELFSARRRRG